MISGILVISSVSLLCTSMLLSFSLSPISCSESSCSLSSYNLLSNSPKKLANPLRDVMISPRSFLNLCNEHFLLCRSDSWDVADTFEVFENSLDSLDVLSLPLGSS